MLVSARFVARVGAASLNTAGDERAQFAALSLSLSLSLSALSLHGGETHWQLPLIPAVAHLGY